MNSKIRVLLVYGTKWGGTVGIANKIADGSKSAGYDVNIVNARGNTPRVADYDFIIVGSGVRADQWTKETLTFLGKNAEELRKKKTALFVSCSMAERTETDVREKARGTYLQKVAERFDLKPVSYGFFGGYIDMKQSHGFFADLVVKVNGTNLRSHGLDTSGVTDNRDWAAIDAWTAEIVRTAFDTR